MDIVAGSTAGRDALRDYLRAGTGISDAQLQLTWDAATVACLPWIRRGRDLNASAGVQLFVLNVAAHLWRTRDSAGDTVTLPDGTATGATITSGLVRRYAVLGGSEVRTPRTVAGGQ